MDSPESDLNISPSFRGERTCGVFVIECRGGGVAKISSSDNSSDISERFRLNEFCGVDVFSLPLLCFGDAGGEGVDSGEDRRRMEGPHTSGDGEYVIAEEEGPERSFPFANEFGNEVEIDCTWSDWGMTLFGKC
jgi:hypothetical protein